MFVCISKTPGCLQCDWSRWKKKSWNKKCFISSVASLAEIASTGNVKRGTICELLRFIASCIKIWIPNAIVYSIKKRGSRNFMLICQSHPVGITSVPSTCSFMQSSQGLERISGWLRANKYHWSLLDIDGRVAKIWSPATEGIAVITTVKQISSAIGKCQAVAVFAFSRM